MSSHLINFQPSIFNITFQQFFGLFKDSSQGIAKNAWKRSNVPFSNGPTRQATVEPLQGVGGFEFMAFFQAALKLPSLKLTFSPLKMVVSHRNLQTSRGEPPHFQVLWPLVSGSEIDGNRPNSCSLKRQFSWKFPLPKNHNFQPQNCCSFFRVRVVSF